MARRRHIAVAIYVGALLSCPAAEGQPTHELRLRSRVIQTDEVPTLGTSPTTPARRVAAFDTSPHLMHFLVQLQDGMTADRLQLQDQGIRVLSYVPDNGLVISAQSNTDFSDAGFRWVGVLDPADKLGIAAASPAEVTDVPGYSVAEFFPDADMNLAKSEVLSLQIAIQDNPNLLPNQLLLFGTYTQMAALAQSDLLAFVFPAAQELINGTPVIACVSAETNYGQLAPFAAALASGGWSASPTDGYAHLTYTLGTLTSLIPADTIRSAFVAVHQQWANYAKISVSESASRTAARNVDLAFYSGDHGDGYPFDPSGMTIAHTFYPSPPNSEPIAGDMHMNLQEAWTTSGTGMDFYSVALHEFGHALGLGHSTSPQAVMYPFYRHNILLSADDVSALQQLYAPPDATTPPPPPPPTVTPLTLTAQAAASTVTSSTVVVTGNVAGGTGTIQVTFATDRGALGMAQGNPGWTATVPLAVGTNTITIAARDASGAAVTKTLAVSRTDTTPPPPPPPSGNASLTLSITSPAGGVLNTSSPNVDVKGTAVQSSGIRSVSWHASTGASGVASGTASWDTGLIGLVAGNNTLTIDAVAYDGTTASQQVQVTVTVPNSGGGSPGSGGGGGDTTPPSLTIVSPAATSSYSSNGSITVTGTASDNVGVTVIRWETGTASGVASGTTNWSAGPIAIYQGMNTIVIRAFDAAGNSSWRSLSVTRQ